MQNESFVFDARPHYPLLIPVKRYWHADLQSQDDDAVTLVFAHATSFHNEHWEPVLEDLFGLIGAVKSVGGRTAKIREAWAIGCPNHGDGGIWNEETLAEGYTPFDWSEFGRSIHLVLAGLGKGVGVDFSQRKLVGVGHSMGAIAIVLATTWHPFVRWHSAILVEPMFVWPGCYERVNRILVESAPKRRDIWPDKETAHKQFLQRFKSWDPRVIELYVRYGLRDLPSKLYPDQTGVTLKCNKRSEAETYKDAHGRMTAQRYLPTFCAGTPTHAVFGAVPDILPISNREHVVKDYAHNNFKTVSVVEDAGHTVVQHNPGGVAERLCEILLHKDPVKGKL
ncbi:Alpha/beta hydrolase fold-1 [Vararia minispora EC-137]|uniref:Alpha/beta hydrolase fold-1 n=1 Tax=Vararia minispora EC-137 TaxID=1314806 RepID=A0ACB8QYZ7_9AGAM|nr:Alpha/beta hydrolase fold-1 [Vararia minispora EC-137]